MVHLDKRAGYIRVIVGGYAVGPKFKTYKEAEKSRYFKNTISDVWYPKKSVHKKSRKHRTFGIDFPAI